MLWQDSESVEMHALKQRARNLPQLIIQGREDVGVFNSFSIVCGQNCMLCGTSLAESIWTPYSRCTGFFKCNTPRPTGVHAIHAERVQNSLCK